MPNVRRPERITRRQPVGRDRKLAAGRQPQARRYREAWSRDAVDDTAPRPAYFGRALSEVPQDLLMRAARQKLPWIRRFVAEGCPRGQLLPYARLYADANNLPAEAVPPYTTLNEWAKRYIKYGGLIALVDAPSRAAGCSRTITGAVATQFELAATLGMRATGIVTHLARKLPQDALPKRSAIYRELARFERREPQLVAMARQGPTWFRDKCQTTLSHGAFAGGVRLSIDSTVADLWVRIPDAGEPGGWRAVRPVLTVIEDVGSRLFVTFNLSLFAVDAGICLGTLGRALDQTQNYPGLTSVSVPHEITLDKGSEHQREFKAALDMLGIEVVPRKDNDARAGAHIERLIGTVTTEVFANVIGYSQTERVFDPYAPADSDTKRSLKQLRYESYKREEPVEALLTLGELEARILAWATVYNERPHRGLPADDPDTQLLHKGMRRVVERRHAFADDASVEGAA